MPLLNLNLTQEAQVLEVLFRSTASYDAPLILLESFMTGVLYACVPLISYMIWIRSVSVPRAPSIPFLWVFLTVMVVHWALSLRKLEATMTGRTLGISLSDDDLSDAIDQSNADASFIEYAYVIWGEAWQYLLPLIVETVLFGFASVLFVLTAFTSFRRSNSRRRASFAMLIPIMASLMYIISLIHWAISIRSFTNLAFATVTFVNIYPLNLGLLVLLSLNSISSDSIVLWRMCVVWDRARPVVALGAAFVATILGLNIVNIVGNASGIYGQYSASVPSGYNTEDTEVVYTFGTNGVGLAGAFVSLASNLSATVLVAIKACMHKRRYPKHLHSDDSRTLVERFLELLVDSGVVYTAIWLLYCISFFREIIAQAVLGQNPNVTFPLVTAATYLDAAMAQLTTIYPLIVFILVALDKLHHSRYTLRHSYSSKREPAVTVTFGIDVERSTMRNSGSAHPMVVLSDTERHPSDITSKRFPTPEAL